MKRLNDLTKYVLSVKYIEGEACPYMEETNDECDNDFAYLEYSDDELIEWLGNIFIDKSDADNIDPDEWFNIPEF